MKDRRMLYLALGDVLSVGFWAAKHVGDFLDGQDIRCVIHESVHSVWREGIGS
jgi:hypothetical protein